MKKTMLFIILLFVFSAQLFSLDIKNGKMRLLLDEKTGRFSVYYLSDAVKNKYISLLYEQETRTSYASLNYDGKSYKLGDASEFKVSVSRKDNDVIVEYKSSFCVVKLNFSFVSFSGTGVMDALLMHFSMENVSDKNASIGLRTLYDTWLGEKSAAHFYVSSGGPLSSETILDGDYTDLWLRSMEKQDSNDVMQVLLGSPATRPDKVIAANWKRLNDSNWTVEKGVSRGFTMLPYSINDSAVALFYEPKVIRPGANRDVKIIISGLNDIYKEGSEIPAAVLEASLPKDNAPLNALSDLVAVRALLDAIDAALINVPSEAELSALRDSLERLEARQRKY